MKTKIINPNNLKNEDLDGVITRVKAFIFNGKNILLDQTDLGLMLPGGHVEDGENFDLALIREVEEETGIKLDNSDLITQFYVVEAYKNNYRNTGKKKMNRLVYYYVQTNKLPDQSKINLTEDEKEHNLKIISVPVNEFENTLILATQNTADEGFAVIAQEMLEAYQVMRQEVNFNIKNQKE